MYTVPQILTAARIKHEIHGKRPGTGVFLTGANQLIGTYADLTRFRTSGSEYLGWEAHHIVETKDLDRLGVQDRFPSREQQICVLIPGAAHRKRVNSVFRSQNNLQAAVSDLKHAYRDAYWLIGDYCGGGEKQIREELMNVVLAVFQSAGL